MTLNSTVRMPPRIKEVSPFRTGRYTRKKIRESSTPRNKTLTVEEIGFQGNIKDVSVQTLNRVTKRMYVHPLATVLDVKALVHVDKVSELRSQVIASHFVYLDAAFLYII